MLIVENLKNVRMYLKKKKNAETTPKSTTQKYSLVTFYIHVYALISQY